MPTRPVASNSSSYGGGIDNIGTLTLANSTITENSVIVGGGIYNLGPLMVVSSTIAYNRVSGVFDAVGGGFYILRGPVTLNDTIVAFNTRDRGSGTRPMISSASTRTMCFQVSAYNLIGIGGSGGLIDGVNGNQVGVADPGLGTLGDNGGPTQTIALLPGSPAIDAGSNALAVDPTTGLPLTTDQRGTGFPRIVRQCGGHRRLRVRRQC